MKNFRFGVDMEAKNLLNVELFVLECNDILSGKFLDLSKRLEKFLSVMTKSEDVLDLLADCLDGFDDEAEFAKAFSIEHDNAKISLPTDETKRLALSVSIFNDLTSGKLNANQFLQTYFQDKKNTPMQNFMTLIVKPFRDILCKKFEISQTISAEDVNKQLQAEKQEAKAAEPEVEQEEEFPHLDELMAEIVKISNQILAILKFEKKHTEMLDDVEFIVNSIIRMCERKDLMVVNGLVIGLEYVAKKFKNIRHLVDDLTTLIYNYYEYLAGESE